MRATAAIAIATLALACGSSGYRGPSAFERQQAAARPAGYPAPVAVSPSGVSSSSRQTTADAVVTVLECALSPCSESPPATSAGPLAYSEQIRGQVLVERASGADVLPFVVVKLIRDGKLVGTTKTDVQGKFWFAKLDRGPHELVLESSRHEAHSNVTVGFGAVEVFLVARAR